MVEARGSVCVISSIGAEITSPVIAAYDSAKAMLDALMRALARELGPRGVRVNIVAPGLIRTPTAEFMITGEREEMEAGILPLKRVGEPEDIAKADRLPALRRHVVRHRLHVGGRRRSPARRR